jgi:hypothetical protein
MVIADEVDGQLIACFEEERAHGFGGGDGAYGVGGVDLDKLPEDFVESFWVAGSRGVGWAGAVDASRVVARSVRARTIVWAFTRSS